MLLGLLNVVVFLAALAGMAFFTLFERKLLAHAQLRKGPAKVRLIGVAQPLADAVKLFLKQRVVLKLANQGGFVVAPALGLGVALALWVLVPHIHGVSVSLFGAILFLVVSRLRVYPVLMAGWSSNRKYALLGTIRAVAQTVSYEIRIALFLFSALLLLMGYNFSTVLFDRVSWSILLIPPLFAC